MTAIIVFSGFNMRAIYAFLRTLEKEQLSYSIIASSKDDEIFLTKYAKHVIITREHKQLYLEDIINSIQILKQKVLADKYFIAPSTEALNRFLLDNRTVLENLNCIIPLVSKELYEEISDKKSFSELCSKHSISIPYEYTPKEIQIPCVAKPKRYVSKETNHIFKPILMMNNTQLEHFFKNHSSDAFYFQEFVEGRSLYLLYYFYKDGTFLKFSQENFIQQSEGRSILAAKSSDFHLSASSKKYEKLFIHLKYRGLVMIEVKVSEKNTYMIEANPRFWGPSQLFVDADVNFFNAMLYDYGIISNRPSTKSLKAKKILYFWDDGKSYKTKQINETTFHNYSKKQFIKEIEQWETSNLLNRKDTKNICQHILQEDKNI